MAPRPPAALAGDGVTVAVSTGDELLVLDTELTTDSETTALAVYHPPAG